MYKRQVVSVVVVSVVVVSVVVVSVVVSVVVVPPMKVPPRGVGADSFFTVTVATTVMQVLQVFCPVPAIWGISMTLEVFLDMSRLCPCRF